MLIKTAKNIKIGETAHISANISADNAIIAGEIKGNLKVKNTLEVKKTAKIIGDIEAKLMSVENGALINGKCIMIKEESEPPKTEEVNNKKK